MKYYLPILLLILICSCINKEYHPTPLKIEFESSNGIEIITQKENAFRIPPNCFEDKNGNDYHGKVTFELIEVFSKEDMIKHDLTTTSNGKMLVSGGMFFLSAKTDKGENLQIKEFESIGLCAKLHLPFYRHYQRFYGITSEAGFNWILETPRQAGNFGNNSDFHHSNNCLDAYAFNVSKLGWINCDYFEETDLGGNIAVKTNEKELKIRLVFNDLNSIMNFQKGEEDYKLGPLPLNRKAKIIAYKESNSKIKFYEKEITIESMQTFEIALEEISVVEFQEKIKNL